MTIATVSPPAPLASSERPEGSFPERGLLAFLVAFSILGILLPAGLVLATQTDKHVSASLVVQFVIVAHSAAGISAALASSRIRIMQFTFWTFVYVWLGLAGAMQVMTLEFPWNDTRSAQTAFKASVIIELGLIAFSMAMFLYSRRSRARPHRSRISAQLEMQPGRVIALAILAILVAVYFVPKLGGLESFFGTRASAKAAADSVTGESTPGVKYALLNWGVSIPAFWALIGLLFARFPDWAKRPWILLLVLLVLVNVVVNNPISQPRFWAGTVILGIIFSTRWMASLKVFKVAAVGLLLILLVAFPYADYFRSTNSGGSESAASNLLASSSEQFRSNGDYDAFQQVMNGVSYVSAEGVQPQMAIGTALFLVPRAIWSGKAEAAGPVIAEFEGYSFTNLSSPLWIEAFIWGGWPTMYLVLFLYGLLVCKLDDIWYQNRGRPYLMVVPLISSLAFLQLMVLRGSLLHSMGPLLLLTAIPVALSFKRRGINRNAIEERSS